MMISVVVPTCHRPDLLSRCLERLAPGTQTLPADQYEVLVTDDGVETAERLLAERFPWAKWGAGPRRGPAANRNAGAKRAAGEWIAFTDDDCVPDANWLKTFADAVHPGCRAYEGKTTWEAGITTPLDHSPVNYDGGCFWSCNILMHRDLFFALGGFDEAFPYPYFEDADLRDRIVASGETFEWVPGAVVDHPPRPWAPGWKLGRYHESWVYHWYKSGRTTIASPRLLVIILQARIAAIRRYRLSFDSVKALGSLVSEVATILTRAPLWEWRYRWRFRSPRPA
jgi:GT2 family glycosyltransferase